MSSRGLELIETIDLTGESCPKCAKGTFQETSQYDDYDGVLHCTRCRLEVRRYVTGTPADGDPSGIQTAQQRLVAYDAAIGVSQARMDAIRGQINQLEQQIDRLGIDRDSLRQELGALNLARRAIAGEIQLREAAESRGL